MTLFYLALAWLAGLWLAQPSTVSWWAWLGVSVIAVIGGLLAQGSRNMRLFFGCVLMAGMGAARLTVAVPAFSADDLATYNGQQAIRMEGVVDDAPVIHDARVTLRVRANKIVLPSGEERAVTGVALVTAISGQPFQYGDLVSVEGDLQTPPTGAQFSYRDYLARAGIFTLAPFARVKTLASNQGSPIQAMLLAWRDSAAARIKQLMPDPEASLLQGILLGNDDGISREIREAFNAVSATHIIAISGANMVVVAGFLQMLARRAAREPYATMITLIGMILYTIFVGANPAVVRAAIMTSLALIAAQLGRQTYGPASLGFAAIVMTAIQPYALWDVGFQLSFLATAGLIFYVKPIKNFAATVIAKLFSEKTAEALLGIFSDALVVTIAAQFMTTPIIALYFGRLPLLSLLVNFLIIPAQPPIMILGGLGVLASAVFSPIGQVLAWAGWLFLAYTVFVVKLFAALPLASLEVTALSPSLVTGFYATLLGATVISQQPLQQRQNLWSALRRNISLKAIFVTGIVAISLVFLAGLTLPDGKLHMTALEVGEGSAMLIQTPSGRHILINAGGDGRTLSAALGERMPFWKRQIDLVIITQPTQVSSAGLGALLERYEVPLVIANSSEAGIIFRSVEKRLRAQGADQKVASTGMTIQIGDGVSITVLNSPSAEPAAADTLDPISLLVSYGDIRIVLPGNVSGEGRQAVMQADNSASSQLLVLPAGNSLLLADAAFVEQMSPQVIIVADSADAPADAGILAEIEQGGRMVYPVSQHGSVEWITDGARLWIQTSR